MEKKLHLEREQETTKLYQSKVYEAQVKLRKMNEEIVWFSEHCFIGHLSDYVQRIPTALCQF